MTDHARGHLFVVHGRIEHVVHDAAVVPTDADFGLEPSWAPVLDGADPDALRPAGWPGRGVGRAGDGRPLWFVSVGTGRSGDERLATGALVERALAAVHEAAEDGLAAGRTRVRPVVALPVLGIEGGGHEHDRGDVVRAQLEALHDAVARLDLDVVVVTPESSVYGAAQHVRGRLTPWQFDAAYLREAERLGRLARDGELALFLGAGVSVAAGLPSWEEMLRRLAERAGLPGDVDLATLGPLDRAQLLEKHAPELGTLVADVLDQDVRPSLAHALLAGLRCREAVTTNYDRLYEQASAATGRSAPAVLPQEDPVGRRTWLLKLHGDLADPGGIVLTRRDFVRFDARTGPAGALLQSLLLTRHLLLVGVSLTDDNVVRLVREVEVYREEHGLEGRFGTLLDVEADTARSELWSDPLAWLTMPGDDVPDRARALEIFLDTVAWYAADASSWVLDPRFGGLLDRSAAGLADDARRLRRRLEGDGSLEEWARLREVLDELGASAG